MRIVLVRIFAAILAVIPVGTAATAHAAGPEYGFSMLLGPTVVVENEDYEDDLTFGGAIHTNFAGPGVEFSVLYTQLEGEAKDGGDSVDVELDLLSFGLAGRYDIPISIVNLYGMAGLDLYVNNLSGKAIAVGGGGAAVGVSVDSVDLGLQVGAGAALRLADSFSIGAELRYRRLLTDNFADDDILDGTGLDERIGLLSAMGVVTFHFR